MLSGGLLPARMNKGELFYGRASYSGPDERYDGENSPDGGGSGAGVNIQPVAFLVVKDGCVRTIQLSDSSNSIDRALTMLPELVEKLTTLVKKDAKAPAEEPKAE